MFFKEDIEMVGLNAHDCLRCRRKLKICNLPLISRLKI